MRPAMPMNAFSLRRNRAALRRLTQRFSKDDRGVAAIEFGILAPVMIALYFGLVQLTEGVMIHRKITQLNRALADLTSQVTAVSNDEIQNIFNAARTVMMPFTRVEPKMSVASVVINSAGTPRICWVEERGGGPIGSVNSVIDLPASQRIPNTSLIVAQSTYDFVPDLGPPLIGTIAVGGQRVYMRPRIGAAGGSSGVEQVQRVKSNGTTMC